MSRDFPKDLITGIEKIDIQHIELFSRLNELYDSFLEGKNIEKTMEIMKYLKHYVNEHFATEEVYMRNLGYPDAKKHIGEHRNFVSDFCKLEDNLNENGYSVDFNLDFNIKIFEWIKNHVMSEDKRLAEFIKLAKAVEI